MNALSDLLQKLNAKDSTDTWSGVANPKFSYWWAPDFENFPAQRQAFVWRNSKVEYVNGKILMVLDQQDVAGVMLAHEASLGLCHGEANARDGIVNRP